MKFSEINNIWMPDIGGLSNADRGRVYFERAKQVVDEVLACPSRHAAAVDGGHFRRSYLIERIGCQPSVTTQNPKIRRLLGDADRRLREDGNTANRSAEHVRPSNPSPMERKSQPGYDLRSSDGIIVLTDITCIVKGQPWPGIPTLVWPDGVDEAASDWLRTLVVENDVSLSSAREYAKIIRPFLRFCRERGRIWTTVDDEFLIMWRERLRRQIGVDVPRINASLKTIFAFYRWAEESKRLRYQVAIYAGNELPDAAANVEFAISAKRTFSKSRHGRVYGNWTTPLTLNESKKQSHARHTPTEDEILRLHEVVVERPQGERDSLIFSWAEEAGPRRAEFMQLGKSHMPTSQQLADLIEQDEPCLIQVQRKGGAMKHLNAPPDLIIRTLDYIQYARREVVEHCLKTIVGYREPDDIFLSSTTGMPLHLDSVTSIGRRAFGHAGIERASIHRLRARFAVSTIEALVDAVFSDGGAIGAESSWIETILIKAAEKMGQSDPRSLRPYLTYVLNRRIQTADASKAEKLASRLRQMRLQEGTLIRRLRHNQDLHEAGILIEAGQNDKAAAALRRIAEDLTDLKVVSTQASNSRGEHHG